MILPDINLLVYAHNDQAPEHLRAKTWWEKCLGGSTPVALSWVAVGGFVRLMTHPRVLARPASVAMTTAWVREWINQPPVIWIHPGERFAGIYLGILEQLGTGGNLTSDAHLAALAMENQATLHSNDTDFSRFEGLRWKNPLR